MASRRSFLFDMGLGFGSVAAASMLAQDASAEQAIGDPTGSDETAAAIRRAVEPHLPAKAKSVIWLFMIGGTSHMESFDPKPALNEHAGKTIEETPYHAVLDSPHLANERVVAFDPNNGFVRKELYPLQVGFRKHGESGLEISDWWPHVAAHADDLCLIRGMWTEDSNHGAQLQFHTGRHRVDGFFPTIGSWVNYGLGSINDNLPKFVVMGTPIADCCGGMEAHRANYLGPRYDGVPLNPDPNNPLPYAKPPAEITGRRQQAEFDLLRELNQLTAEAYPTDESIRARMEAYELAFRMQTAVPEVVDLADESDETEKLYGLDQKETADFGRQMLTARRLVQRGVRFVQVYHGSNGGAGSWDSHQGLKPNHSRLSRQVDQPIGALLTDLRRLGLLDETIVVWATEFGRTPGSQHGDGRDHHPFGFTVWMAGGGIRGGIAHGATDEIGFHAVEDRHYVTDVHATILHQLGLNSRDLSLPGRKRIEKDYGNPIRDIMT